MATGRPRISLADVANQGKRASVNASGSVRPSFQPLRRQKYRPKTELFDFAELSKTIKNAGAFAARLQADADAEAEGEGAAALFGEQPEGMSRKEFFETRPDVNGTAFEVEMRDGNTDSPIRSIEEPVDPPEPKPGGDENNPGPPGMVDTTQELPEHLEEAHDQLGDLVRDGKVSPNQSFTMRQSNTITFGTQAAQEQGRKLNERWGTDTNYQVGLGTGLGSPQTSARETVRVAYWDGRRGYPLLDPDNPNRSPKAIKAYNKNFAALSQDYLRRVDDALAKTSGARIRDQVIAPSFHSHLDTAMDTGTAARGLDPTEKGHQEWSKQTAAGVTQMLQRYHREGIPMADATRTLMMRRLTHLGELHKDDPDELIEQIQDHMEVFKLLPLGTVNAEVDDHFSNDPKGVSMLAARMIERAENGGYAQGGARSGGRGSSRNHKFIIDNVGEDLLELQLAMIDRDPGNDLGIVEKTRQKAQASITAALNGSGKTTKQKSAIIEEFTAFWERQVKGITTQSYDAMERRFMRKALTDPDGARDELQIALMKTEFPVDSYKRVDSFLLNLKDLAPFKGDGSAFNVTMEKARAGMAVTEGMPAGRQREQAALVANLEAGLIGVMQAAKAEADATGVDAQTLIDKRVNASGLFDDMAAAQKQFTEQREASINTVEQATADRRKLTVEERQAVLAVLGTFEGNRRIRDHDKNTNVDTHINALGPTIARDINTIDEAIGSIIQAEEGVADAETAGLIRSRTARLHTQALRKYNIRKFELVQSMLESGGSLSDIRAELAKARDEIIEGLGADIEAAKTDTETSIAVDEMESDLEGIGETHTLARDDYKKKTVDLFKRLPGTATEGMEGRAFRHLFNPGPEAVFSKHMAAIRFPDGLTQRERFDIRNDWENMRGRKAHNLILDPTINEDNKNQLLHDLLGIDGRISIADWEAGFIDWFYTTEGGATQPRRVFKVRVDLTKANPNPTYPYYGDRNGFKRFLSDTPLAVKWLGKMGFTGLEADVDPTLNTPANAGVREWMGHMRNRIATSPLGMHPKTQAWHDSRIKNFEMWERAAEEQAKRGAQGLRVNPAEQAAIDRRAAEDAATKKTKAAADKKAKAAADKKAKIAADKKVVTDRVAKEKKDFAASEEGRIQQKLRDSGSDAAAEKRVKFNFDKELKAAKGAVNRRGKTDAEYQKALDAVEAELVQKFKDREKGK